jgi:hypothetical protein
MAAIGRLIVMLAADVAGYASLIGADEESALVRCAIVRDRPKTQAISNTN